MPIPQFKFACIVLPLLAGTLTVVQAAAPEGYYTAVDTSSSASLRASLHETIDDHQRIPYTASETDTWDVLEQADRDLSNPQRIITLYRNASFARVGGGNDHYNREHTWPKSYGYPDDGPDNYPYTDMHALFLSDADYNYNRSNSPYRNCDAGCVEFPTVSNNGRGGAGGGYPGDSNWQTGQYTDGTWEVWKGRRGDVARALMYMDLRYEGGTHGVTGSAEPDLRLTDDIDLIHSAYTFENRDFGYMGMLSVLLEWHREDPVDLAEVLHHETVAAYQGNRNPFIDHPEWAECIYGNTCNDMLINAAISDAWFNPLTNGQGFFIVVWEEISTMFLAWFTYDSERPPEDISAILGEPGHRWITAQGPFSGDTATLDIYVTRGGQFDSSEPAVDPPVRSGTMHLHFSSCTAGTVEYDMPDADLAGVVPIQRIVADNVPLCETLNEP